ncbi:MAG TPA: ABC transporter permease [Ilumatobacteraceae bacterium]
MTAAAATPTTPTTATTGAIELARMERRQARKERWRLLRRRPGFIVGAFIFTMWVICAIGGEALAPYDPYSSEFTPNLRPGGANPFGTDNLGRDVLSRVMVGARDVLIVAPLAAIIAVVAGTMLGLSGAYLRGTLDEIVSRVMEAILSIPLVMFGLLVLTTLGLSNPILIMTVAVLFTPIVFRTVRAAVLAEAQLDYVTSARLRGEGRLFIMTREILPNISGPIIVELTVRVGYAIFTIATLMFVVGGGKPDEPAWGNQIAQMYNLVPGGIWWPTIFPALAIATLVTAINLIADSVEAVYAT